MNRHRVQGVTFAVPTCGNEVADASFVQAVKEGATVALDNIYERVPLPLDGHTTRERVAAVRLL